VPLSLLVGRKIIQGGIVIIEFDHKKSTVTFGGGRFVCFFIHHGIINKTLEMRVFEANENFQPLDPKRPLFSETVAFDERKILSAIKIVGELDSGTATWIPSKCLSKDANSKEVQDLEETSAQMAFGKATILLGKKDYEAAVLNITASLLSTYLRKHPKYESRFLRKQAEAYTGLDNYLEAKKAMISAMEKYKEDSNFDDYFSLGCIDYKLGHKEEAVYNFRKFIELANVFLSSSRDNARNNEIAATIEMSNKLMNKLGY